MPVISKEQMAYHVSEGKRLAMLGELDASKVHMTEAQTIKSALELANSFDSFTPNVSAATRPPLPNAGTGSFAAGDPAATTTATAAAPHKSVLDGMVDYIPAGYNSRNPAAIEEAPETSIMDAFYISRFGTGAKDSMVKAILKDLHGPDYQQQYYESTKAFRKYMRVGPGDMTREEKDSLRRLVLTPKSVKMGLDQGIENLAVYKATMVEAADSLGGVLVPVDFQTELITRLSGLTVMRGRARQQNTTRDKVDVPKQTGGNSQFRGNTRVKWVDENPVAGLANTNMTFGMEGIDIHTTMATVYISKNNLEDAALDIESYMMQELAESVAIDEDNQFLVGDSVGKPRAILPNGVMPLVNGANFLVYGKSLNASALTWQGLINTTFAIDAQYRKNCAWIANKATYGAIANLTNATSGAYLWQPFQYTGGASGGAGTYSQLLGYPTLEQEIMPAIGANSYPLLFADLQGYRLIDRVGMSITRYDDGTTAEQNMVKLVLRRRLGGQVTEPWRFVAHQVAA